MSTCEKIAAIFVCKKITALYYNIFYLYRCPIFLISNFRGCGKTLTASTGNGGHYHVSYNYLPPGLREMEAKKYVGGLESDAYVSSTSELELSADPMNSILDPNAVILKQSKKEVLPKKKYFTAALHLEWIMYLSLIHI